MLNMTWSRHGRNVQAERFPSSRCGKTCYILMQVSLGAIPGSPFSSEYFKTWQKWMTSRTVSSRWVLSDYHLVVPAACLHINKWAKSARLMTECAVWFSCLYFSCLLCCSHMHYSLNGVWKKNLFTFRNPSSRHVGRWFWSPPFILCFLKLIRCCFFCFNPSHPPFYLPFTIINIVIKLPDK